MSTVDRYLDAATRANTRRSYASAVRHFEVEWGGHLPATADSVAQYLVEYAEQLAINTLKQRLAALAQWHSEHGFVDPTRSPRVRQVLKGIQTLHPAEEKRAEPLQLTQLAQVMTWLQTAAVAAEDRGDRVAQLRHLRDCALVSLGFWRGFRGDELIHLQVEHVRIVPGQGMTCFLPPTNGRRRPRIIVCLGLVTPLFRRRPLAKTASQRRNKGCARVRFPKIRKSHNKSACSKDFCLSSH